eukprot:scaffold10520_cov122-Isochrysis_galbana.AAC.6
MIPGIVLLLPKCVGDVRHRDLHIRAPLSALCQRVYLISPTPHATPTHATSHTAGDQPVKLSTDGTERRVTQPQAAGRAPLFPPGSLEHAQLGRSAAPPSRSISCRRNCGVGRGVTRVGDQRRTGTVATDTKHRCQELAAQNEAPSHGRQPSPRERHRQHPVEPPLSFCALQGQGNGSWSYTKDPGAHPRRLWLWKQRGTLAALCRRPGPAHMPPPPCPPSGARLLLFGELLVGPLIVEAAQKGQKLVLRAGARGGRGGPVSPDRAAAARVQSRE